MTSTAWWCLHKNRRNMWLPYL